MPYMSSLEDRHIVTLPRMAFLLSMTLCLFAGAPVLATDVSAAHTETTSFPHPLDDYADSEIDTIFGKLQYRIQAEPFNLVATLIFLLAILHTFLSSKLLAMFR